MATSDCSASATHAGREDDCNPLLKGTGLFKSFGTTPALRGGDIEIRPGEIVAVMGPSGSGKSTLLHCLAGIIRPDAGTVTYAGRPVTTMSDRDRTALRRTEFGFVFQFGQLIPELSAAENVALPLILSGHKRRHALEQAHDWLQTFDLQTLSARRPGEMSGGQAQRVAVARAMITDPRLVFADEPTGSLDSAAGITVLSAFTSAARCRGVAVIMVTHEARVAAYADRAVVVRDGTIIPSAVDQSLNRSSTLFPSPR